MNEIEKTEIKVFLSYAHVDKDYFEIFVNVLKRSTKNSGNYKWNFWFDKELNIGSNWQEDIEEQVLKSDVAILFVSNGFFDSDFIKKEEFEKFLERESNGSISIIPLLFAPCDYSQWTELSKKQFFMPNGERYDKAQITDFTFADLIKFRDSDGKSIPNPNIDRYIKDFVGKVEKTIEFNLCKKKTIEGEKLIQQKVKFDINKEIAWYLENATYENENIIEKMKIKSKKRNELMNTLFNNFHVKISDSKFLSEHYAKDIIFEEIAYNDEIGTHTLLMIDKIRRDFEKNEFYERSLIVSALTIGLLIKYNKHKLNLLIDFLNDKEEFVWKRALVGIVMGITKRERMLDDDIKAKLSNMSKNYEIQNGILEIIETMNNEKIEFTKIVHFENIIKTNDYLQKPQYWFLPFYEDNFIAKEKIKDKSLRKMLVNTTGFDLDLFKYLFCLNYDNYSDEQIGMLKVVFEEEKQTFERQKYSIVHEYREENVFIALKKDSEYEKYISELYVFYKHFPQETFSKILKENYIFSITETSVLIMSKLYKNKLLANLYYREKAYEKAEEIYENFLKHYSNDLDTIEKLINCQKNLQKYDEAEKYYKKALEIDPNNVNNTGNYALFLHEVRKDYDEAEKYYKKALEINPNNANIIGNYALFLHEVRKDYDEAEKYYKKALEINPNNANNTRNYALFLHEVRKDYDEAEKYYKKALEIDPNNANIIGNYASFLKNIRGDYDEAEKYYKKALEIDPNNANTTGNYASFLKNIREDYDEAEKYYKKALEIDPNNANNTGNYVLFLHEVRKDYDEAEKYYKKALEIDPNHANNTGNYALFLKNIREDYDEAEKYYKKALEIDPNHANNTGNYASFLEDIREDYDEAEKYYKKALEIDPNHANNTGNYALFLKNIREDYDEAEKYYKKALEIDPNHANNTGNYALFLHEVRKDYDEAEKYYKKALEIDPNNANTTGNYAKLKIEIEQYFEAEKLIDRAIELNNKEENGLLIELWFYRYAIFDKWSIVGEKEIGNLLEKKIKSLGCNLELVYEKAKIIGHKNTEKLYEFKEKITK